jgi:hypothetical protein
MEAKSERKAAPKRSANPRKKEKHMSMYAESSKSMGIAPDLRNLIATALAGGTGGGDKSFMGTSPWQRDAAIAGCQIGGALSMGLAQQPSIISKVQATASKAYTVPTIQDPTQIGQKGFWGDVCSFVEQTGPVLLQAALGGSKDFTSISSAPEVQRNINDPEWKSFVTDLITQVGPLLLQALSGKDFRPDLARLNITVPPNKDKNWLSDAANFVVRTAPVWGPVVLAAV